uniref:Putative DNA-directed RNA polymerase subunit n=1 Tax=Trypanosoma congolense (strain IL3000) TaxID=1068625 RepID=G0UZ10_TRYCI|nr:putative DNA-directed RNA polymerase subunit [Trypanosoma congolense IL3000]
MMRSEIITDGIVPQSEGAETAPITPAEKRRSGVYLTKYEVARILGERARQIVNGTSLVLDSNSHRGEMSSLEIAEGCTNPYAAAVDPIYISKVELLQKKIPMIVRRIWPDGWCENIPVSELLVDKALLNL